MAKDKERVKRSKCVINGQEMHYDLWNSKKETLQKDVFEYLGYGRVVSVQGKSKIDEKSEFWTGHFWRKKKIPEDQAYVMIYVFR